MSIFDMFRQGPDIMAGVKEFKNTTDAILLDVRTSQEYHSGHVPGSRNVPLDKIQNISIDKEHPLYVYCHSGARSGQACAYLEKKGYRATNIGGITGYNGVLE